MNLLQARYLNLKIHSKFIEEKNVMRERLTENRQYSVASSGLQDAVNTVLNGIDLSGYNVTINLSGTHSGGAVIKSPWVGAGEVIITGASSINSVGHCFHLENGARVTLSGGISLSSVSGAGIYAAQNSQVVFKELKFGQCAASHIDQSTSANVFAIGDYEIIGGATSHLHVTSAAILTLDGRTISVNNTPHFSAYFVGVTFAMVRAIGASFSGPATGYRHVVHYNGAIRTNTRNPNFFPGDKPGVVVRGGVFDDL
jgi:hypothetical protein